jgi:hypothetical protein
MNSIGFQMLNMGSLGAPCFGGVERFKCPLLFEYPPMGKTRNLNLAPEVRRIGIKETPKAFLGPTLSLFPPNRG